MTMKILPSRMSCSIWEKSGIVVNPSMSSVCNTTSTSGRSAHPPSYRRYKHGQIQWRYEGEELNSHKSSIHQSHSLHPIWGGGGGTCRCDAYRTAMHGNLHLLTVIHTRRRGAAHGRGVGHWRRTPRTRRRQRLVGDAQVGGGIEARGSTRVHLPVHSR